jgi:F-type H+-transporting ATPase subunit b
MPQFDPTWYPAQLFWLLVCFVALYLLLSRMAMPRLGEVLHERQRKIDDNLDKAAELKAEADAALAAYDKALADSRAKAHDILRANNEAIAAQAAQRQKELGERLTEQIKAGEANIAAAREQALGQVRELAIDVANAATTRLTGFALEEAAVSKAVASTLGEGG